MGPPFRLWHASIHKRDIIALHRSSAEHLRRRIQVQGLELPSHGRQLNECRHLTSFDDSVLPKCDAITMIGGGDQGWTTGLPSWVGSIFSIGWLTAENWLASSLSALAIKDRTEARGPAGAAPPLPETVSLLPSADKPFTATVSRANEIFVNPAPEGQ